MTFFHIATARGRLHVGQLGPQDGRPLVLLHHGGGGFSVDPWPDPFPALASEPRGWRILRVDRLGYGLSSPRPHGFPPGFFEDDLRDLETVLDALEPTRPLVLQGTSDGGSLALMAAARWPKRVCAVAIDGAHHRTEDSMRPALLDMRARFLEKHGPAAEWDPVERATLRAWFEGWLAIVEEGWSVEDDLPRIHCPVAVLQGELDGIVSHGHAHDLASRLGKPVPAHILPGGAHLVQRSHPQEWAQWLWNFLQSLPPLVECP